MQGKILNIKGWFLSTGFGLGSTEGGGCLGFGLVPVSWLVPLLVCGCFVSRLPVGVGLVVGLGEGLVVLCVSLFCSGFLVFLM